MRAGPSVLAGFMLDPDHKINETELTFCLNKLDLRVLTVFKTSLYLLLNLYKRSVRLPPCFYDNDL